MANKRTVKLVGQRQRDYAKRLIDEAPEGWCMSLGAETRRDAQNRRMHAMIKDIRNHVPDMARFSAENSKLRFLDALGEELSFLPKLRGEGMFPVGLRSSTLSVAQFSALIEIMFMYGAEEGVVWTDPKYDDGEWS